MISHSVLGVPCISHVFFTKRQNFPVSPGGLAGGSRSRRSVSLRPEAEKDHQTPQDTSGYLGTLVAGLDFSDFSDPSFEFWVFSMFFTVFFLGSPGVRGAKAELTETTKRSPAVQDDVDMEFGRSVDRTGLWDLQMSCGRFQVA